MNKCDYLSPAQLKLFVSYQSNGRDFNAADSSSILFHPITAASVDDSRPEERWYEYLVATRVYFSRLICARIFSFKVRAINYTLKFRFMSHREHYTIVDLPHLLFQRVCILLLVDENFKPSDVFNWSSNLREEKNPAAESNSTNQRGQKFSWTLWKWRRRRHRRTIKLSSKQSR